MVSLKDVSVCVKVNNLGQSVQLHCIIQLLNLCFFQLFNGRHTFNINVESILAAMGQFPTGQYLEVEANVYESATGNEESMVDNSVIFADQPVYFKLSRSKRSYRPGIEYILKVLLIPIKVFFLCMVLFIKLSCLFSYLI